MFDVGSEIVVLGSNVKTKSGPRVGSIGHVCWTNNNATETKINNEVPAYIGNASIIFNRYGYQEGRRAEVKSVCVVLPKYSYSADIERHISKFINIINNIPRNPNKSRSKPIIFASDLITSYDFKDVDKCVCSILSALCKIDTMSVLKGFLGEKYKYNKVDYTPLTQIMTPEVEVLCIKLASIGLGKRRSVLALLRAYIIKKPEVIKGLLSVIGIIQSLRIRSNGQSYGNNFGGYSSRRLSFSFGNSPFVSYTDDIFKSMFKNKSFLKLISENSGKFGDTDINRIKESKEYIRELAVNILNNN
jgi:hypothetical protein